MSTFSGILSYVSGVVVTAALLFAGSSYLSGNSQGDVDLQGDVDVQAVDVQAAVQQAPGCCAEPAECCDQQDQACCQTSASQEARSCCSQSVACCTNPPECCLAAEPCCNQPFDCCESAPGSVGALLGAEKPACCAADETAKAEAEAAAECCTAK